MGLRLAVAPPPWSKSPFTSRPWEERNARLRLEMPDEANGVSAVNCVQRPCYLRSLTRVVSFTSLRINRWQLARAMDQRRLALRPLRRGKLSDCHGHDR